MRTRFSILLVFVIVLTLVPLGPAAANGYWPISEDTTLTEDYYGTIEIVADGKTLDCDGFKVSWEAPEGEENAWFGIGMLHRSGVTVKNCEVSGDYGFGIISYFGSGNTVENNEVYGNGKGIAFHQSHDNEAVGNQVYENDEYGIGTYMGDRNVFSSNIAGSNETLGAGGNGGSGISVSKSVGSVVEFNETHGNVAQGIGVWECSALTVDRNEAIGNGVLGFKIRFTDDSLFTGNSAGGNGELGFLVSESNTNTLVDNEAEDNGVDGIYLWQADDNVVIGNVAEGNGETGFGLGESDGNEVTDNSAQGNGYSGLGLYKADDTVVTGNTAKGNVVNGIDVSSSVAVQVVGNTATGNCTKPGWTCAGIRLGSSSGSLVEDNTATDNVNYSPHGQAFGIFVAGSVNSIVSNNLLARNSNDGIHLGMDSDGNTVVDNTSIDNLGDGIDLHWADSNMLTGNVVENNRYNGFAIHATSNGNTLTGNLAIENGQTGFDLGGGSHSNTLTGNEAHRNVDHGFAISESGNTLERNTSTGNGGVGFGLWEATNSTLIGNLAEGNGDSGFGLGESDGNQLTDNSAQENGYSGFGLYRSDDNTLENNQADRNAKWGFEAGESSFNMLIGNQAVGNGDDGFAMWRESHDNVLRGNHAVNNRAGFVNVGGHSNTYEGNHAVNNKVWTGFWFSETEGNTVINNVARNNGSGFQLDGSHEHELSGNSAVNNKEHGFVLWGSSENALTGNTAINNGDKKSEDGGIGFDVGFGSIGNTLAQNRGHNNTICDASDWSEFANSWSDNDIRVWCEPGEDPDFTPVEWRIVLDDWGPGINTVFMTVVARPLAVDQVDEVSGRLVWDETTVELCGMSIRDVGEGYLLLGDIFQTTEGCYEGDTAMQDAFDSFGLPETACVAVTVGGVNHEYCAPLLSFVPVQWTIELDAAGEGIHSIFMVADVSPLTVDDVQDLGGSLVWDETEVTLCSDPSSVGTFTWISIREEGDGYLTIGDGFQSNDMGGECSINADMQAAFDDFGLPQAACLFVRTGDRDIEYCARLDVLGEYPLLMPGWTAAEDVYDAGYVLAEALYAATGEAFFVVPVESPMQMYDLMCAMPETAVGVGVNSLVYSFASEDCGVDASFKSIRFDYDTYWTEFLVPRDGDIDEIGDLDGRSWAYPSAGSTSGYYVSLAVIAEAGVTPGDVREAGGHAAAVSAVYYGEADFGTVFYSPYIDVNWNVGWDFDPANADIPDADVPDCHIVTAAEAEGAFAEGDLVCGEYEVRDARRLVRAEAPDVVQEVEILTLSPPIPNDAVAFGAAFPTELRTQVEEALVEFADEAGPYFEDVWVPSLDLLYSWQGINPAADSDWDWMRGALANAGFGAGDL